ncbi:MAG: ABC transporter ATP-binding protein [Stellaceae bacterium]
MSLLETRGLSACYGDFQALFGIDFTIAAGETVAIIGANGAGKTTFLKAVIGLIAGAGGEVVFEGRPIGGRPAHEIVCAGISLVPEGRKLFPSLSVEENLRMGAYSGRRGGWSLKRVYELFPVLAEKRHAPATSLSGGQQQMVAIGRALMSNPRLMLCDELSLGLAPAVIKDIYARLAEIAAEGATLVIVEQDINQALAASDRFYCFQEGRVSLTGAAKGFDRAAVTAAYFGV